VVSKILIESIQSASEILAALQSHLPPSSSSTPFTLFISIDGLERPIYPMERVVELMEELGPEAILNAREYAYSNSLNSVSNLFLSQLVQQLIIICSNLVP
jgi:hypothetical protein